MIPNFRVLGFWGIAKMAFLFQITGLTCAVVASALASMFFPAWVRSTFDMHQWNLPMTVIWLGGFASLVLYPFIVSGTWLLALTLGRICNDKTKPNKAAHRTG
jgi:hypothetical protein